jgi:hypothetical protein
MCCVLGTSSWCASTTSSPPSLQLDMVYQEHDDQLLTSLYTNIHIATHSRDHTQMPPFCLSDPLIQGLIRHFPRICRLPSPTSKPTRTKYTRSLLLHLKFQPARRRYLGNDHGRAGHTDNTIQHLLFTIQSCFTCTLPVLCNLIFSTLMCLDMRSSQCTPNHMITDRFL